MSTVNKAIANRIIAGEFEEDNIVCIIRYENIFDGNYSYKVLTETHVRNDYDKWILDGKEAAMIDPVVYWRKQN